MRKQVKNLWHRPTACWILSICWLLFISWLAFFWYLGSRGLVDETEPLFAEAARQMTVTGNWITPYFNGETRFDKPPLIYWLMAISYQLLGVNEWAVRLPSALSATALISLGFYTLRYFSFAGSTEAQPKDKSQLWLAAGIGAALMAFNIPTIVWARTGVSDMLLSGCMGMALLCFFWGYASPPSPPQSPLPPLVPPTGGKIGETGKIGGGGEQFQPLIRRPNGWYLAGYVLLGLAVLTKGPVGIVLPGLIIVSFLFYTGKLREVWQEMGVIWGAIIFLLITLPWYILVILQNGQDYIDSFFGYHNFERFTGVVNGHDGPWYFYFLVVLVGFIPWSIYLPAAMGRVQFWRRSWWRKQPRGSQLSLFAFFWFSGIFIFFTIAVTKLPSYVLPLLPAAAILVALWWSEELSRNSQGDRSKSLLISSLVNFIFLVILAIFSFISPNFIGKDPAALNLAELFAASGIPLYSGIIWAVTALMIALLLLVRARIRFILIANLIAFIAFILVVILPAAFLLDEARQLPLRELAAIVNETEIIGEDLLMIGFKKPSLAFYSQRQVKFLKNTSKTMAYLEETAKIESNEPNTDSILILARPKYIQRANLKPEHYQMLAAKGSYQLIRVNKQIILNLQN